MLLGGRSKGLYHSALYFKTDTVSSPPSLLHGCLTVDMESIDALAKAVNEYEGGMVLVSHDMRLISQVANENWICDNKTIEKYKGAF